MEGVIKIGLSKIHYIKWGEGPKLLLAFHGFGESADSFSALVPFLKDSYTVIAVDIPLHGKTIWDKAERFDRKALAAIIKQLMKEHGVDTCSLMGYSLGGKLALAVLEEMPSLIDKLVLMAPDGLKPNIFYNLAVYSKWGNKLFKRLIQHGSWFLKLIDLGKGLKLIPLSLHKFLYYQFDTVAKRQFVYDVWAIVRDFEVPIQLTKNLLNKYHIKTFFLMGKYDKVIRYTQAIRFKKGLRDSRLILLERGHKLLDEHLGKILKAELK